MTTTNTNGTNQGPRLSVSTWSLHRQLGRPDFYGPEEGSKFLSQHMAGVRSRFWKYPPASPNLASIL